MKNIKFILSCLLVAILSSCEKDIPTSNPNITSETTDSMEIITKGIAKATNSPEVVNFIIENADRLEFGDYEFLIKPVLNTTINGSTLLEILSINCNTDEIKLQQLFDLNPNLTIALHNHSLCKTQTSGLNTFFVTEDSETADSLYGYTSSGQPTSLATEQEPTYPVILIKFNERTVTLSIGDSLYTQVSDAIANNYNFQYPVYQDATSIAISINDYYQLTRNGAISSNKTNSCEPIGCVNNADRDIRSNKDLCNYFQFESNSALNNVEPWYYGGPEIEMTIAMAQCSGAASGLQKVWTGTRNDYIDGNIHQLSTHLDIVNWNESTWGSSMLYKFIEIDATPDWSTKLTLGVTTKFKINEVETGVNGSLEIAYKPVNDNMGSSYVEYCDPADWWDTDRYSTGTIKFHVWEKHN